MSVQNLDAKYIQCLPPVADAFSGTVATDVVNAKRWEHFEIIVVRGAGATGNSVITVEVCDDTVPTNTIAIPFRYRETAAGTDVFGDLQSASGAGYVLSAGANRIDLIEVDVEAVGESAYPYIRARLVEGTDSPVLGAILIRASGRRYATANDQTDLS